MNSSSVLPPKPEPEAVHAVKRLVIKCADVSNTARSLALCRQWAKRIAEECFHQAGAFIAGFIVVDRFAAFSCVTFCVCVFLCHRILATEIVIQFAALCMATRG